MGFPVFKTASGVSNYLEPHDSRKSPAKRAQGCWACWGVPNPPENDGKNENSTCIGSIHFRTGAVCSTTLTMRCDCSIDNTVALTHLAQNTFTSQSAMYFQFTKSTLSHSPCLHLFYETILPSKSEISGSHPKPSGRSGGRIPYIHAV